MSLRPEITRRRRRKRGAVDAEVVVKAVESISGEVGLRSLQEQLLVTALELADVEGGALLTGASDDRIAVIARATLEEKAVAVSFCSPPTSWRDVVPPPLLEDALRTREPALLGSACCLPLIFRSDLLGALYLARGGPDKFPADRLAGLSVLARVGAASLARAERYAELERENAELRQHEDALSRSEDLYRRAIVQAGAVPYVFEYATNSYTFIGDAIEELTGYPPALFTPDFWQEIVEEFVLLGDQAGLPYEDAVRRTRSGELRRWRCEQRIRTRAGESRWISDASVEVIGDDGRSTGSIGLLQDITERRELEAQLAQAQKMEAVGRLAGGIAHDFNNLLTAIGGYSMLVLGRLEPGDALRHEVEEISKAGELAAALTHQLLVFSRRQVLQPQVLDLNAVVADVEMLLRRLIRDDIVLDTRLARRALPLSADPGQLTQVIVNLVVNAEDAMPGGGRLTIETAAVDLDESAIHSDVVLDAGPYALLSVADTGMGMDEETRGQIFEPFFTTKQREKGTGLGLSTVFGIVEQSGGHVVVDSEPGRGSSFAVYLPRVDDAPVQSRPVETGPEQVSGHGSVLLVEDDEAVRKLARDVLLLHGYTVVDAATGDEALDVAREWDGPLDLLVTDLVMPGISGRELAERLVELWPDLRVLFMSGYSDDAFFRFGTLPPGHAFLQKPFTPGVLARKARDVLATTS